MSRLPKRIRSDGFSLVEALVALTMLSAGVLMLGGALTSTNRAARGSLEATVAEHLVRQKLASFREGSALLADGAEQVRLDGVQYTRTWRLRRDVPRAGLVEVRVAASWSDYAATLVEPLSRPLVSTLTDVEGTVDRLATGSGRARSREIVGYVADR